MEREFTNRFYCECEGCGRDSAVESITYLEHYADGKKKSKVVEHRKFCPDCGWGENLK